MPSSHQLAAIPTHLRQYVVEQDYAQYTDVDHAVWRFVLLQMYAHLQHAAHASYRSGLNAAGIRVDAIPRIAEMHDKLARFGWSAVCVDGFIPPRAFQAFQANRILPIAAAMRSPEHLAYTPAPDIIHEAAGHAPILSEPTYAEFIQRFGAVAERAFGSPEDRAVHDAIHLLSELKEDPASTAAQVQAAGEAVQEALSNLRAVSESTRLSRLYWWTAEYGLIGRSDDFKLYGAGLLSSLFESHSCLDEAVRKVPLSSACVEVDYDITQAQPQLFVARDFDHLIEVLDEVSAPLSFRVGGAYGMGVAQRSQELATLTLDSGLELSGIVTAFGEGDDGLAWVQLSGAPALFARGAKLKLAACPNEYVLPLGPLLDGSRLSTLSPDALSRHMQGRQLKLAFRSGATLSGQLCGTQVSDGRVCCAALTRFELRLQNGRAFRCRTPYPLALGELQGLRAGAPDSYFPATEPSPQRVPRPRWLEPREQDLLALYERAVSAWRELSGAALVQRFEQITRALDRDHPDDWLLRWNLLESLVKVAEQGSLSERLAHDLRLLEIKHLHREPIATGLAYIRSLVSDGSVPDPRP